MAKKRKRQEEKKEEREYKPPEFDRLDYVRTEVGVSKATIFAALFAIPIGLAGMFVMPVGGVAGGLVAGLGGMSMLWFIIPVLKIDIKPFKWTHWAGVFSTYFLVFLTVWVVACNPPFNDFAHPEIREVQVSWNGGASWVNVTASALGGGNEVQRPANATSMLIRAQVTDNVGVNAATVMASRGSQAPLLMTSLGNDLFECAYANVVQLEYFTITAADTNGNSHDGYSFSIVS